MRGLLSDYIISRVMSGISYFTSRCSQQLVAHQDLAQTATRSMATAMLPCNHSRLVCPSRRSISHFFTSTSATTGVTAALGWPVIPLHLQRKVGVWSRAYNAEEAVASSELATGSGTLPLSEVGTLVINPNLGTVEVELSNGGASANYNGSRPVDDNSPSNGFVNNGHASAEADDVASTPSNKVSTAVDSDGTQSVAAAEGVLECSAEGASSSSSSVSDVTTLEAAAETSSSSASSDSSIPAASSNSDESSAESSSKSSAGPLGPPIRLLFQSGAAMLPHPDKAHRGGEDSFFIADHQSAIGVADGVGGWAEIGVDAGAYARLLMVHAKEAADAAAEDVATGTLSAQQILETAFYKTSVQGSSTACVLVVNGITLSASNLGDSGFVLVRDGVATFQSPQQQHNFNFPFQLGSAESMSDQPQAAMRFELELQPGDIIVTGSDGLWDNIFAEEAATITSKCRDKGETATVAAQVLCRYARMRASDAKYHSPFSYSAIAAGYVYLGGKMDDITVLVSYVALPPAKL